MGAREALTDFALDPAAVAATREYPFSARDFDRVRRLIYARAGINLNESKQNMVYSRLSRRLRATGLNDFPTYLDRIEQDAQFAANEEQEFVNALTTNLTAFFREGHHFPVFAQFLAAQQHGAPVRVWCAAAATGEEPYSIAMTILDTLSAGANARLLATDIDTNVLAQARRGVYRLEAARACGDERLRRHFLRGTGANDGLARVRPEVARLIDFAQLNLLEAGWEAQRRFADTVDAVFIRNVMIYFDKPTQRRILERIAGILRKGGLLFVGHSENFTDSRTHFVLRGKTVYERV